MLLVVYVDDFELAGPKENMQKCWNEIRKGIRTDEPSSVGKYLGCDHIRSVIKDPLTG